MLTRSCLSCLASIPVLALAAPPEFRLPESPPLAELIKKHLPDLLAVDTDKLDRAGRQALRRDAKQRISDLLATEGYFSPEIHLRRNDRGKPAEQDDRPGPMTLTVIPGPQTQVKTVHIRFSGPELLPPDREAALSAVWSLPEGKPFRQTDWDKAKNDVLGALLAKDYAQARLIASHARIDPETRQAELSVDYDTGPRIIIGEIRIEGLKLYENSLIDRYNNDVHPGDAYDEEKLRKLQNALQSSPYFNQVLIELDDPRLDASQAEEVTSPTPPPDANAGQQETNAETPSVKIIPLVIRIRERSPHRIGLGAGFSSNNGARVEINYHGTHLFNLPWEINSAIRLEQRKQTAFVDIFLPPEKNGARNSFGVNYEHTNIENLDTRKIAVGAAHTQRIGDFDTSLGLNLQQESQSPDGATPTKQTALALLAGATWRKIDSNILPRDGHIVHGEIGGASKAVLSDQDFLRLYGRYQGYFSVGERDVLSLRGEVGATLANSSNGIPQDYVFRTGGTQTIRGYDYQSLGVENGNAIVGGRYLSLASIEYTHWLAEPSAWGIAAFIDGGNAGDSWKTPVIGAGLGVRYRTPAGPVAVDLAYGFDKDARAGGLHLHFTLAIPF